MEVKVFESKEIIDTRSKYYTYVEAKAVSETSPLERKISDIVVPIKEITVPIHCYMSDRYKEEFFLIKDKEINKLFENTIEERNKYLSKYTLIQGEFERIKKMSFFQLVKFWFTWRKINRTMKKLSKD